MSPGKPCSPGRCSKDQQVFIPPFANTSGPLLSAFKEMYGHVQSKIEQKRPICRRRCSRRGHPGRGEHHTGDASRGGELEE